MIPSFPRFKKLELADQNEINELVKLHAPYSDFNFTSLWSYNTQEDALVSLLNHNLIIRFRDYLTNEPFYSFLGTKKILETTSELLEFIKTNKEKPILKLVPEIVILAEPKLQAKYNVLEDRDNFDYILSTTFLAELHGNDFNNKKWHVNRFLSHHPHHKTDLLDLKSPSVREQILNVFNLWETSIHANKKDTEHERTALQRLLKDAHTFNLFCLGIFVESKLVGFTLFELSHQKHAIGHFMKSDHSIKGIFEYMHQLVAKAAKEKGYPYLNSMQDLGFAGLRVAKTSWRPIHFLKKYTISVK